MRVRSLVLFLAVLAGCGPKRSVETSISTADHDRYFQVFADSPFTYCDAAYLGAYWGISDLDAKIRMGSKIANGQKAYVEAQRDRAFQDREKAATHCSFYDAGFAYSDAEALGALWGIEPWEAKKLVEERIAQGEEYSIYNDLKVASDKLSIGAGQPPSLGYGYCDARMVASVWEPAGADLSEVKGWIDDKVANGNRELVDAEIRRARETESTTCDWSEISSYGYDDAEALATAWGLSIEDAKATISRKYTSFLIDDLHSVLGDR